MAYYDHDGEYEIGVPFTLEVLRAFRDLIIDPVGQYLLHPKAVDLMEYLGCDEEWAQVQWRLMCRGRDGLTDWQWRAVMDVMLRASDGGDGWMKSRWHEGPNRLARIGDIDN